MGQGVRHRQPLLLSHERSPRPDLTRSEPAAPRDLFASSVGFQRDQALHDPQSQSVASLDVEVGSRRLSPALIGRGLVDELRLLVYPVVLGAGGRLFGVEETTYFGNSACRRAHLPLSKRALPRRGLSRALPRSATRSRERAAKRRSGNNRRDSLRRRCGRAGSRRRGRAVPTQQSARCRRARSIGRREGARGWRHALARATSRDHRRSASPAR